MELQGKFSKDINIKNVHLVKELNAVNFISYEFFYFEQFVKLNDCNIDYYDVQATEENINNIRAWYDKYMFEVNIVLTQTFANLKVSKSRNHQIRKFEILDEFEIFLINFNDIYNPVFDKVYDIKGRLTGSDTKSTLFEYLTNLTLFSELEKRSEERRVGKEC